MESGTTFSRPSVVQNRFCANGRSPEITSTTVLASAPARSLNLRVEIAHTGVSRLGTMFRILRFPRYAPSETSARSPATRRKSGTLAPTAGRSPVVWMGLPFSVMLAMARTSESGEPGWCTRTGERGDANTGRLMRGGPAPPLPESPHARRAWVPPRPARTRLRRKNQRDGQSIQREAPRDREPEGEGDRGGVRDGAGREGLRGAGGRGGPSGGARLLRGGLEAVRGARPPVRGRGGEVRRQSPFPEGPAAGRRRTRREAGRHRKSDARLLQGWQGDRRAVERRGHQADGAEGAGRGAAGVAAAGS